MRATFRVRSIVLPAWVAVLQAAPLAAQPADGLPPVDLPALIAECESCHGPGGVSDQSDVPSLAGLKQGKILAALEAFYYYERHCPTIEPPHANGPAVENNMCSIASSLSDDEASALADYFASRPRPAD